MILGMDVGWRGEGENLTNRNVRANWEEETILYVMRHRKKTDDIPGGRNNSFDVNLRFDGWGSWEVETVLRHRKETDL